jgi:hypothetical protein
VNRAAAVLVALFLAVHVSVLGIPAPVAVLLAFAAAIGTLSWAIAAVLVRDGILQWRPA